jgi:NADPH-dependent glutamate synthase beta subunit-like oxidoreductase
MWFLSLYIRGAEAQKVSRFYGNFRKYRRQGKKKADPKVGRPSHLRTAVPGVFVAGDCRVGAAMQLVTAVSDGVLAAMMIKQYSRDPKWWTESVSDVLQPGGW